MKVEIASIEVEKNIDGEHHQMGIKNPRVIVDFMVNRLYTDKIKAITQEISCNARDAHREARIPEQPIEITIPNSFTPYFVVRDFGLGMNLDRLTNTYKYIGESTKRNDNVETGGFGIGAKCPWAYSDVFTTETVAWENDGKKYKRVLVLHRTPENDISFDVISCEETNEATGTLVKVPVKEQDYHKFLQQTVRATQFWTVRPIIKGAKVGDDFSWMNTSTYLAGTGWTIFNDYSRDEHYIVNYDGIPYPIDTNRLKDFLGDTFSTFRSLFQYTNKSIVINANIGEVNVALNRESLEYSAKTIQLITKHMNDCLANLKEFAIKNILEQQSLLEATKIFHMHYKTLDSLLPDVLEWTAPNGDKIKINPANYLQIRGTVATYTTNWRGRLQKSRNSTISFSNELLLICKDAAKNEANYEPPRSQILGMLDTVSRDKTVQVIVSYDIADENTVSILKQHNLTTLESYPKRKNKPRTSGGGVHNVNPNTPLCWQVTSCLMSPYYTKDHKWSDFKHIPYVIKETTHYFKLTKEHTRTIDRHTVSTISSNIKIDKVIAIRAKDEAVAISNGLVSLYSFVLKQAEKGSQKLCNEDHDFFRSAKTQNFIPTLSPNVFIEKLFTNEKHLIHKFVKMVIEAKAIHDQKQAINYTYYLMDTDKKEVENTRKDVKNKSYGLNALYRRLAKQYPMLRINPRIFQVRDVKYYKEIAKDIMARSIQYINLVDKKT